VCARLARDAIHDWRSHPKATTMLTKNSLFATAAITFGALALAGCDESCEPCICGAATGGRSAEPDQTAGQAGSTAAEHGGAAGATAAAGPLSCTQDCTACANGDAAELFAWDSVPTFDVTLPEERWEYLQEHALDEEYVEACAAFEGTSIGPVGLRFKGAYGTLVPCFNERGEMICTKLGMKLKFNEIDENLSFYGLKRLNLHSMIHDETKLHERLGYDLYRDMGLPAPRSAWAVLRVNGESYGLFSMVEQVDGRFTADRWPEDGDGNLYKEAWPSSDNPAYYAGHLETNEETATHDVIVQFASELSAAEPDALASVLANWMDFENFQRYMAVDDAIFNCDGITAIYSSEDASWAGNHNYYLYQFQQSDTFQLIPWDLDSIFRPWASWSLVPRWDVVPDDCSVLYPVWSGDSYVLAPGCQLVFQALASDLEPYRAAVDELLEGPFAEQAMLDKIDELAAFIADAVEADPLGPSRSGWEGSVESLKNTIAVLRERLEHLRDGLPVLPFGLSTTGVNDFEAAANFELTMGTTLMCNPSSTVSQSINSTDALEGAQDLRLDFEYRNEQAPWEQWIYYSVPLAAGLEDLSSVTGIRLVAKADRSRNLRLDLESPANSYSSEGIRRGWDVTVGTEPTEVEVLLADAEVQDWAVDQGRDPGDALEDVLSSVTGLAFHPECQDRDLSGFLPEGTTDVGHLQVDMIEFFTE
jgi:spore coat protein H